MAFLRTQGAPRFDETLMRAKVESEEKEERGDDADDLYDRAVSIVAETRNASISYVQRRLKVGYNRAARMIEQMEEEGVIGPQIGTKPREVFAAASRRRMRRERGVKRDATRCLRLLLAAVAVRHIAPDARAAEAECAGDVAARVQQRYEKVEDLAAHFEQTTRRVSLGDDSTTRWSRRVRWSSRSPGKMRWSYTSPEPSLVVSDGADALGVRPSGARSPEAAAGGGLSLRGAASNSCSAPASSWTNSR